jgi:hypothetical protein
MGSGLCSALLPACTRLAVDADPVGSLATRRPELSAGTDMARAPAAGSGRIPSPYQETTPPAPWPECMPHDAQVTQTAYPLPPARPPGPAPAGGADPWPIAAGSVKEAGEESQTGPPEPEVRHADEPPLVTALRCFLEKQPEEALEALSHYDKANQDLLLGLLPLAARLTEKDLVKANAEELAHVVNQLDSLLVPLRARATLTLDKMCFCRRIEKYGVYDPLPEGHWFHMGEPVQVYVELQNVSSRVEGDTYVSQLASSVEIHDPDNRIVWHQGFGDRDRRDVSHTLRHDYFNNYRFCVPEIPPGQYTLWIRVDDVQTGRHAQRWLDFPVTTVPGHGL